jgi:hypothetical protein
MKKAFICLLTVLSNVNPLASGATNRIQGNWVSMPPDMSKERARRCINSSSVFSVESSSPNRVPAVSAHSTDITPCAKSTLIASFAYIKAENFILRRIKLIILCVCTLISNLKIIRLTSSLIRFSIVLLPKPKFRRWRTAKFLCSCQWSPSVQVIPVLFNV